MSVQLAMKAVPNRVDFYKKLGGDDLEKTMALLVTWLSGLEKCVKILVDFFLEGKHEY
jgi:hypothetical protein